MVKTKPRTAVGREGIRDVEGTTNRDIYRIQVRWKIRSHTVLGRKGRRGSSSSWSREHCRFPPWSFDLLLF